MKGDADLSEASVLVEPFTRSGAAGITSGDVEVLQACEGEAKQASGKDEEKDKVVRLFEARNPEY